MLRSLTDLVLRSIHDTLWSRSHTHIFGNVSPILNAYLQCVHGMHVYLGPGRGARPLQYAPRSNGEECLVGGGHDYAPIRRSMSSAVINPLKDFGDEAAPLV